MKQWTPCKICGATAVHTHHVFFGIYRSTSDRLKLLMPVCLSCHECLHKDEAVRKVWQRKYEKAFRKKYGDDAWWNNFDKSWL